MKRKKLYARSSDGLQKTRDADDVMLLKLVVNRAPHENANHIKQLINENEKLRKLVEKLKR